MTEVEKQILTNQLCILATLRVIGAKTLYPMHVENIQERIKETIELRDKKKRGNK